MSSLQTLDRGLRVLDFVSLQPTGVAVSEIAKELDVHRAIAYRLVGTLEDHGLVTRTEDGRVRLGAAVATLSRRFAPQLMAMGRPVLNELADRTQATSFVSVAEGDECVVVMVEEARGQALRVSYREGTRHPLHRGAPGLAILATRAQAPHDSTDVLTARERGYALTHGQLQPGATGVSVGLTDIPALGAARIEASIGVVVLGELGIERAIRESRAAAVRLGALLSD